MNKNTLSLFSSIISNIALKSEGAGLSIYSSLFISLYESNPGG